MKNTNKHTANKIHRQNYSISKNIYKYNKDKYFEVDGSKNISKFIMYQNKTKQKKHL